NVMLGYYNAPDLSAEVLKDGWFYTGDIGYLTKDGFLIITGRKKNVIVTYNGKNIFPEELEAYLARNEMVKESAVIGIMNDRKKDYDIVALVVPEMEKITEVHGKDVTPEKVRELMEAAVAEVNDQVQNYKRMNFTIVRDEELPKNTSRKVKRFLLHDLAMEDYLKLVNR
ncbi:MAG: AMP-binding protein, partial [Clostridia bacterium]|nr:AMP-binding protein [Clostridia bacterium]